MHHIPEGRKSSGTAKGLAPSPRAGVDAHMSSARDLEDYLARIALGDRGAFDGLYRATSAKLFGVCLRVLKNQAEAEELLQETYLQVWEVADRFRPGGASPMSWLITIARNRSIDRLRQRKPVVSATRDDGTDLLAEEPDPAPGPERLAGAAQERQAILRCLAELPEDRAEAVRRAYLEGDTYAELATRFGVPLNTMRTWLRRSLLKLKECLSR